MKIKTKEADYDAVRALPRAEHKLPRRPGMFWRLLMRIAAVRDLRAAHFTYTAEGMEKAGPGPYLILMNHSSFIDLEIVARVFFRKPYCIICTSDGFVGKERLMRSLGCIPTQKFVPDLTLVGDMLYTLKKLDVPVVMVSTRGAFSRDPLYNCLQKRKVPVSASVRCLLTREEIRERPSRELTRVLDEAFTFDHFAWQRENEIRISETFRADGLNRILYRCAACGAEGQMEGKGTRLTCRACGKTYEMDELGQLRALKGETRFSHIPDWYAWERQIVRQALLDGSYCLDVPVKIGMMVDYKAIYMVGQGRLHHDREGFRLTGCGGRLTYTQPPLASYSLYADYYWYELGDVICIGDRDTLYYCFPQDCGDVAAKTRLAAEELYKLVRSRALKAAGV